MRLAVLSTVAAMTLSTAMAAERPKPCKSVEEGGDPRVRCAKFSRTQVYSVPARFGSHVTIVFADSSTVLDPVSAKVETLKTDKDGKDIKPEYWQGVWDGNTLQLTPLRFPILTTAMTVPVKMRDGRVLNHLFQIEAKDDNTYFPPGKQDGTSYGVELVPLEDVKGEDGKPDPKFQEWAKVANEDTVILVQFTYDPKDDPAPKPPPPTPAMVSDANERRSLTASSRIAGTLRQEAFYGSRARNWNYVSRGDKETEPQEISDNGLDTVFKIDPGLSRPNAYRAENGVCDGKAEAALDFDTLGPGVYRIHGSYSVLCFRRAQKATEVRNLAYDPTGVNPGTGTISPNVVRVQRRGQ